MGWLREWRTRRAAKQYARRLGPHLQRAYGASEHYTAAQVRAGVAKLGLSRDFIAFGFAAFMSEEEFVSRLAEMPMYVAYDEARELFERFRPTPHYSTSSNPENTPIAGI